MEKLGRVFKDAAVCAPIWFAGGNLIWAAENAEKFGIFLNALALTAVVGAQINASLRKGQLHFPYTPLAFTNIVTALSIVYLGLQETSEFAFETARTVFQSAAAPFLWGITHWRISREIKDGNTRPDNVLKDFRLYNGLGLLAITTLHPGWESLLVLPLIALGLKEAIGKNEKGSNANLFYAGTYAVSIALAIMDFGDGLVDSLPFIAAQTLWLGGNMMFHRLSKKAAKAALAAKPQ